jgi:sugar lactone lactonase YvrE
MVKCRAKAATLLLLGSMLMASAQSAPESQSRAQDTQVRGFWTDPSTGLMWAGRDNDKDVSWKNAAKYCRDLRLAGYSDWRLPTLAELGIIYDRNVNAPGLSGPDNGPSTWHVKGNLFLTGYQWSSERRNDDRGHPSGYAWFFDFNDGKSNNQPTGFPYSPSFMRGLCVRGSGK